MITREVIILIMGMMMQLMVMIGYDGWPKRLHLAAASKLVCLHSVQACGRKDASNVCL